VDEADRIVSHFLQDDHDMLERLLTTDHYFLFRKMNRALENIASQTPAA
jgi:hypothetical protein